jgi:hypothetical protein
MAIVRGTDAEYLPTNDREKIERKEFQTDLELSRNLWKTIQIHLEERGETEEQFFEKMNMTGKEQIIMMSNVKPTFTITKRLAEYFDISDYFELFKQLGRLLEA